MRAVLLSVLAALLFAACSTQPLPKTDPKSVMAGATFDPGRCRPEGPSMYTCDQPGTQAAEEASTHSDTTMLRGQCGDGSHYSKGQCVPNNN